MTVWRLAATFFYLGKLPVAPGSFGSLGALFLWLLLPVSFPIQLSVLVFLFIYQYGLDFKRYPKIPSILSVFILSLLLLMFISSLASDYTVLGLTQILRQILFFGLVYGLFSFIKSTKEVESDSASKEDN